MAKFKHKTTINGEVFRAVVTPNSVIVYPEYPEGMCLAFMTTGPRGGNHSHGGAAALSIQSDNGVLSATEGDKGVLSFEVKGDFELKSLAAAIVFLGQVISAEGIHLIKN